LGKDGGQGGASGAAKDIPDYQNSNGVVVTQGLVREPYWDWFGNSGM
jgi:hypothetical protein